MNESLGASLELFTCVNKHLDPIGLQEDFLMASHHLPIACRHGQRFEYSTMLLCLLTKIYLEIASSSLTLIAALTHKEVRAKERRDEVKRL
ncbi:uncharacterized [Tachysurus ichikawai]